MPLLVAGRLESRRQPWILVELELEKPGSIVNWDVATKTAAAPNTAEV